jgi:2-hydroxycyclohexanecarboxyl-CoA dehydrogenase
MMNQTNQVAIVTGGAQGIGEAIALRLAGIGYHVAILDLQVSGQDLVNRIKAEGGAASFHHCDLTDLNQVRAIAKACVALGTIVVLVNNAGWSISEKFLAQDPSQWKRLIDINYVAVLNVCHTFGSLMEGGAIVNVSSDAARIGVAEQAVYSGAKAAVIGFSKAIAVEFSKTGIRVNVVCPGTTRTPLVDAMFSEEDIRKRSRIIPLGRLAMPDDLAKTVVFLATEATHVTGQVISVSGGASRVG